MQLDLFAVQTTEPSAEPDDALAYRPPVAPRINGGATPATASRPANLQEAFAHFEDGASDHPARIKIRSGFKAIGRVLRLPLDEIPADPERLRPMLASANWALAGLKRRRWIGAKSDATRGLRDLGLAAVASRDETAMSHS